MDQFLAQAEAAKKAAEELGDASAQFILAAVLVVLCIAIFYAGRWVKNKAQEAWDDLKKQRNDALKLAKKAGDQLLKDTKEREAAVVALAIKVVSTNDELKEAITALTVQVSELTIGVEGLYEE